LYIFSGLQWRWAENHHGQTALSSNPATEDAKTVNAASAHACLFRVARKLRQQTAVRRDLLRSASRRPWCKQHIAETKTNRAIFDKM